jgi:hypothetical protein
LVTSTKRAGNSATSVSTSGFGSAGSRQVKGRKTTSGGRSGGGGGPQVLPLARPGVV